MRVWNRIEIKNGNDVGGMGEESMGWPALLVMVRHGESEGNIRSIEERAGYTVPTHGYPLTQRGKEQARVTGKYLNERFGMFDTYYVSYYTRAKETMNLLYPHAKVYEDPCLAEAQRGIWHTMTKEEVAKNFPGEIERKEREGLYHYRPIGGENWPDIELRIHSFLGTLARDYEDKKVLIVVHGHWLLLLQRLIHHFSIDEALEKYRKGVFENTSVTVYHGENQKGKSRLVKIDENIVPWKDKLTNQ
jgi:broad specificity phosphatase PhoE